MKTLPADLVDPLHILSPFPWRTLALLAAAAALALLWALWRRRLPALAPAASPAPAPRPSGFRDLIDGIQRRYLDADRRRGCHELSAALRSHYDASGEHRFSTSTVDEIASAVGDTAVARFFALLAGFQFGRREPSRNDFQGVCELARSVVAVGGKP